MICPYCDMKIEKVIVYRSSHYEVDLLLKNWVYVIDENSEVLKSIGAIEEIFCPVCYATLGSNEISV